MKVTVIGKEHIEGTGKKSGKPFNLNVVHFNAKKNGVEGVAAETAMLDAKAYPITEIQVGKAYNLEYDSRGFVACFDPAQ